jgi:hypothetical protein
MLAREFPMVETFANIGSQFGHRLVKAPSLL